jgi:IPT/TIG domain/Papain family cysteine protease
MRTRRDPGPTGASGPPGRRTAAVAVATIAAAVVAGTPGSASAAPPAPPTPAPAVPHVTGLKAPATTVSPQSGLAGLASSAAASGGAVRVASALPTAVDLTGFAVPAGNQGQHGACASWTTAYTIAGWESNYTRHAGAPFGPMFVYNQVNGGSDTQGTTFYDNFRILESQGDVEAGDWTHPFSDFTSQPTADERADAALHVLSAHTTLFAQYSGGAGTAARTAIETALANNQPVALGIPVYDPFFDLDQQDSTFTAADATGALAGWHAVTALGYSPQGVTIENSWGDYWGNHGFATLGWDFVEQYVREAYAAGTFAPNGLVPSVTGLSTKWVTTAGSSTVDVTGLRLLSVDTSTPSAVSLVSVADPTVSVAARAVTRTSSGLTVTAPALPATGEYRVVVRGVNGPSAPHGTDDVVTAVAGRAISVQAGRYASTTSSTWVLVSGSGFGATSADFAAAGITATVGGARSYVSRYDDTHLYVYVPPGAAGTSVPLVVYWNGVPSAPATVTYQPSAPVVTAVKPARIAAAGRTAVTVAVSNAASLGSSPTVTLVSTTDPAVTLAAPVTRISGTAVTFTAPAAPGSRTQDFHVVVTGPAGRSATSTKDVLGYRTPLPAHPSVSTVSAAGGTVTLTGSGFGTSAAAFAAQHVTATVAGRPAVLRWISDRAVSVAVPAGKPGASVPVVLSHDTVAGPAVTGLRYGAVVTRNSAARGPRSGWTTTLTGVGFPRAGSWALVDSTGRTRATLPVVTSRAALSSARHGAVLVSSATSALVKLPAMAAGTYRLRFAPDQRSYPGASLLATDQGTVVFR